MEKALVDCLVNVGLANFVPVLGQRDRGVFFFFLVTLLRWSWHTLGAA